LENKEILAAITALLSVGVLLLNTRANMVQTNLVSGLALIGVGAALILVAVYLFKVLATNAAVKALKQRG